ncbi:MAG: DUF58 domain-containing protein [Mariprofundus sp.]
MAYDPADLKLPTWLLGLLDTLIRMRTPILPGWQLGLTRPGMIFVAGQSGVWAAAFYSGNNLLYLCAAMLLALMLVALLQAAYLLTHLPEPVLPVLQVGENTVLRHIITLPVSVICPAAVALTFAIEQQQLSIEARCHGHELGWHGRLRAAERGLFRVREILLDTAAPLGLFVLGYKRAARSELLVLPAPVAWDPLVCGQTAADAQAAFTPGGDLWHDLRAYVAGDSPRHIHWRKAQGEPGNWAVKRFATAADVHDQRCLRVDLRMPAGLPAAAFERLLGRAWFWVQQWQQLPANSPSAELILGRECFDLGHSEGYARAIRALAGAKVSDKPPAGDHGLLLSLVEDG